MIISHLHKFVFVKTTKTAGTSIEIALSRHCGPDDVLSKLIDKDEEIRFAQTGRRAQNDHVELKNGVKLKITSHDRARRAARYLGPRRYQEYFTFAFERNPFDRLVSAYFYMRENRIKRGIDVTDFTFESLLRNKEHMQGIRRGGWKLYTENDIFIVDKVYKFEELDDSLADIFQRLGIKDGAAAPHTKKTSRKRDYREYYTPRLRAIVEKTFAQELEYFDYSF